MAENEGRSALGAGKATAHKFIDLLIKYLLPLGTFFVGVFTGTSTWGGFNAVWHATASSSDIQSRSNLISGGLFGGIFGLTGYAFWSIDGGKIGTAVGRGFGGYFWGVAVSYLIAAVSPSEARSDGLFDELVAGLMGI